MRYLFSLLFICSITCSAIASVQPPTSCDGGSPHPNAPAELRQFAFLIGDYQVHLHMWLGQQWSPPQPGRTARWNGWYGLQGMTIVDEWFNPDPAQDANASRGVNVRLYDADAGQWKMMWMDTVGKSVQDLRAEMRDGVLTMWQVYPERLDFKAEFIVDDADHWQRVSYTRDDDGHWVKQFKLAATRIPCENRN